MLKVTHITTHLNGGAGIACLRLHEALLSEGIDSNIITLWYNGKDPRIHSVLKNKFSYYLYRLFKKIPIPFNKFLLSKLKEKFIKGNFEIFSNPFSIFKIQNFKLIQQSDILNLHWISEIIDYEVFFKNVSKPIVWTLHDMNPFCGAFHYKDDRHANTQLSQIDKKYEAIKKNSLAKKNIHFVCLNNWMKKELESAGYSSEATIHNSISLEKFQPEAIPELDTFIDQNANRKVVTFVASNLDTRRKGFDLLLESLLTLDSNEKISIVVVDTTQARKEMSKYPTFQTGKLNLSQIAYLLSRSNVFVLPSREDNLPNVVVESLVSGCPVVAFSVGGLPEMINNSNGFLAKPFDTRELGELIRKAISTDFKRSEISEDAKLKYSKKNQAEHYIQIYKSLYDQNN